MLNKISALFGILSHFRDFAAWHLRQYTAPSPHFVKQICLLRHGIANATWVETGTYLGDTTRLLARHASMVYSIEPEPSLYGRAKDKFAACANVEIIHGTSEEVFPNLLPRLSGDVSFWLDGHYSAGLTYKGDQETPIIDELSALSSNLFRFQKITVLVDDVRCFNPAMSLYAAYPPVDFLVAWAQKNKLSWQIEHDIFIAKNH